MELLTDKRTEWLFIDIYRNVARTTIPNNAAGFSKIKATSLENMLGREERRDEERTSEQKN